MKQLQIIPTIHEYENFLSFANDFSLSENDLIFTNECIDKSVIAPCGLTSRVLYREAFGRGEPTDVMINSILDTTGRMDFSRLIAVGGGAITDIAKVISVSDGTADVDSMFSAPGLLKNRHELIIIPTTCGTGTEVTNLSIINRTKIGVKQGLGSDEMTPAHAVLISEFIRTLPYHAFATSSIDALIHCIESYLSPLSTPYTRMFSVAGIKDILAGYLKVSADRECFRELGADFLRAANYGGIAFGNAGCGTVHAMSYALGGKYHVPHGESNYAFLITVLRFYSSRAPQGRFTELTSLISECIGGSDPVSDLDTLINSILPRRKMSEYGAVPEDVPVFAQLTYANQSRLLSKSPVPVTEADLESMFAECL